MMQWFRLYAEFARDPKVQRMSEVFQRRLVMLYCLRCDVTVTLCDSHRDVLCDDAVTFGLRISDAEWQETKAAFIALNFIDKQNNIINWDKRQKPSDSSAARTRAYRDRHVTSQNSHGDVTVTDKNRIEEKRIDKKRDIPRVALADLTVDHVKDWLGRKRVNGSYLTIDETALLEKFKQTCQARGYRYKDYVAAFKNSFDWENAPKRKSPVNDTRRQTESEENQKILAGL